MELSLEKISAESCFFLCHLDNERMPDYLKFKNPSARINSHLEFVKFEFYARTILNFLFLPWRCPSVCQIKERYEVTHKIAIHQLTRFLITLHNKLVKCV